VTLPTSTRLLGLRILGPLDRAGLLKLLVFDLLIGSGLCGLEYFSLTNDLFDLFNGGTLLNLKKKQ